MPRGDDMRSHVHSLPADIAGRGGPDIPGKYRGFGAGQQVPSAPVTFPPRLYPPPGSTSFYAEASASLGPGPATWTVPANIVRQIPNNCIGVVRAFNLYINSMVATTVITYKIRVNGGAVPGFDNLVLFPRAAGSVGEAFGGAGEVAIDIPVGGTVDVLISIADAGVYVVGASYYGWYYPVQLAQTYQQTGGY